MTWRRHTAAGRPASPPSPRAVAAAEEPSRLVERPPSSTSPTGADPAAPEPIRAWLDIFTRLLNLPDADRRAIRAELEDHLRERTRDLMLAGEDEAGAVRRAIDELGEAVVLAQRFAAADRPRHRRRLAMTLGLFGLSASALMLSVVAIGGYGGAARPAAQPPAAVAYTPLAPAGQEDLDKVRVGEVAFKETRLADVLEFVGKTIKKPMAIHWTSLEESGRGPDTPVTIEARDVTLPRLFRLINEATASGPPDRIDYRLIDGTLEIASSRQFDRQESTLVAYDLSPLEERHIEADGVVRLISSLVEPEQWRDNGGDLATSHVLGASLFIEAPPRFHAQVRWILDQLAAHRKAEAVSVTAVQSPRIAAPPRDSAVVAKKAGVVHVGGEVVTPGVYLVPDAKFTLLQALTSAGGIKGAAADREVMVIRSRDGQPSVVHRVRMGELTSGAAADPAIEAGDHVMVK